MELGDININIQTKSENSRLYKLLEVNIGDKINLTDDPTTDEIENVMSNLKKEICATV